jgi:hypothetical protein
MLFFIYVIFQLHLCWRALKGRDTKMFIFIRLQTRKRMSLFKGTVSCDNYQKIVEFFLQHIIHGGENWALLSGFRRDPIHISFKYCRREMYRYFGMTQKLYYIFSLKNFYTAQNFL